MKILCLLLIFPTFASAEIKQGVTYTFSATHKSFTGSVSSFEETAAIIDEKDSKVLVQRKYRSGDVYSYWDDRSKVDGELNWSAEQIKKTCKGTTSLITVPAGTFVTCPMFDSFYEDHRYYGTVNTVKTWYGPVLDGIVKVEVSRETLGDHRTSTETRELKSISE